MPTTPLPRPWMPLYHRRRQLALTTVPRARISSRRADLLREVAGRKAAPSGWLASLRHLLRNPPPLRLRLDDLTAESEAWIAGLGGDDGDTSSPS